MSYIAIARKWRPKRFEEIAGQKHITKTLENAISRDRVHHAYLFSGPRGVGKTTAARTLARSLNCEQGPNLDPCSVCSNCLEILAGNNPDVVEIDGASNNSVDDIRDLRESVQFLPTKSPKRIYIIDEVHMLSKGAFNALLKTLEEPPAHVLFIFATTEPQKIPDTILSRVQRFEFKRIPAKTVTSHLKSICDAEGINVEEGGLQLIARAGEGSMRDSQSLLDQVISFGGTDISLEQVSNALGLIDRSLIYNMLEGIVFTDANKCLHAINIVYDYGYDLSEFSSELLELIRNATMVQLTDDSGQFLDISDSELQQLKTIANKTTPDVLVRSFQVMIEVHEQLTHSNRPKLVLEMAVARLISIRPVRSIDSLIERLGKIEGSPRARESSDDPLPRRGEQTVKKKQNQTPQSLIKVQPKPSVTQTSVSINTQPSKQQSTIQPPSTQKEKPIQAPTKEQTTQEKDTPPSKDIQLHKKLRETKHTPPPAPTEMSPKDKKMRDTHYSLFAPIRQSLVDLGSINDVLANHSCIIEQKKSVIKLGISEGFKLDHIQERLKSKEVRELFSQHFPQSNKIIPIAKPKNSIFESYQERKLRQREEQRYAHTVEILNNRIYQLFTKQIPTRFAHFTLEDEHPHDQS
ncbi:MAG: DNA polymerase III subunit gamma/tau [Deltaproteobacteria bacterium]|nr:DNA polymerase III subunit gamma/tau [Deltaproteobacteria bacterium]